MQKICLKVSVNLLNALLCKFRNKCLLAKATAVVIIWSQDTKKNFKGFASVRFFHYDLDQGGRHQNIIGGA